MFNFFFVVVNSNDEEFKLWSNGLKRVLLDHNIERMEYLLNHRGCCNAADIRCHNCRNSLYYIPVEESNAEIRWVCVNCPGHEILRCKSDETCNTIIKITKTVPPQLVALTLNIILTNMNRCNCLSTPATPDNPIEILNQMYLKSKDSFKLGGTNVVIVADIFKSIHSKTVLPILYLADTVNIPTRYYLHALKSDLRAIGDSDTEESRNAILSLLQELIVIANTVIKTGSYLLLGPTLQAHIPPKYYNDKLYKFNLRAIVPLTELKVFEMKNVAARTSSGGASSSSNNNIEMGLEKIVNPALSICSIVNTLILRSVHKYPTKDGLYRATQKYLTTAIWLRMFVGTPFEALLYHIIHEEEP